MDITLPGLNDNTLGQHHMAPPSSERTESDKSLIRNQLHDETDFVHVSGDHDPRCLGFALFAAYDTTEPVLFNNRYLLKMFSNDLTNLLLIT